MDRLKKSVIVTHLVRQLRENDSWCGETHLQKAMYFVQALFGLNAEFDFILYKHGPFSFSFRGFLEGLLADDLLRLEPQQPPYGPRMATTEDADTLEKNFPKTLEQYGEPLKFVAENLGGKGVSELERLATALFIKNNNGSTRTVEEWSQALHEVKPHIALESARIAVEEIDILTDKAKQIHFV